MIDLVHSGYVLPDGVGTLAGWTGGDAATIDALAANGCGNYRYVAGERLVDLAARAVGRTLDEAGVARDAIDAMIICQTSPCSALPAPFSLAGAVRAAAGLDRAWAFAVTQQQCVSPIHAVRILAALFAKHGEWKHALVVTVDNIMREDLRALGTAGMHSDAASALLVGRRGTGAPIVAIETFNDARAVVGIDSATGRFTDNDNYLWSLVSVMRRVAKTAATPLADCLTILPHNVNRPAWSKALGALRLDEARLFDTNFRRVGHACGSDAAINIADSAALARPGKHLAFASGIGGCFGAFIFNPGGR